MFLLNRLFSVAGDCQELESAHYQIQRGGGLECSQCCIYTHIRDLRALVFSCVEESGQIKFWQIF